MPLKQKAIQGVIWTGSSTFVVAGLNFVINAVLARLLSPHDFGLMGLVLVVTGFAMMTADFGVAASVIHKQNINEKQLSTFFYLNLLTGFALSVLCYGLSDALAALFGYAELSGILKTISVSFLIVSFGQVMRSLLQKQIEFKTLFKIDVFSSVLYGVFSITLAVNGFGVWSLAYGLLIKQCTDSILLWIFSTFRPRYGIDFKDMKSLLKFGMYVYGEKFLNYFNGNLDNILIGKFLGLEALGYYTLAYNLMLIPVFKIGGAVSQVAFPAFSTIQNDDGKIRNGYLKMIRYISLVTFPIMGILFVVAPEFIDIIYGPKWAPAVLVLQILCVVGAARSIATTLGSVLYAKGRSDIGFKMNIFAVICNALAFIVGLKRGIAGVAAAYAFITISSMPIDLYLLKKLISLDAKSYLNAITSQAAGTVVTVGVLLMMKPWITSEYLALGSLIVGGAAAYSCFIYFTNKKIIMDGMNLIGAGKNE